MTLLFSFPQIHLSEGFWGAVAALITISGGYLIARYQFRDRAKDVPTKLEEIQIYKVMAISLEIDNMLKAFVKAFPWVKIVSVVAVTDSDFPTNAQILSSSDEDTYKQFKDKFKMEHLLRKVHMEMMLEGDARFDGSSLHWEAARDWYASNDIVESHLWNIMAGTFDLGSGNPEIAHLGLYVNKTQTPPEDHMADFHHACRLLCVTIREKMTPISKTPPVH